MSEKVQSGRNLATNQRRALEALLSGLNKQEAAAAAGVTPRTLSRWINEDVAFYEALQQRGRQAVHVAARRLSGALDTAVDVLVEVMRDEDARPAVRVRAASVVADMALKLLEASDVIERLDELEAKVAANDRN